VAPAFHEVIVPSRVLLTIASSDEETMAASRADSRAAAEYRSVISSHGIGASPLHLRYLLSAVADIDAKFLAARLIRREPAACTGMSINTRRQGRSLLFRDSIPSDLGQRLSKCAENCRKRKKYLAGTGSSITARPTVACLPAFGMNFPGEAEGRLAGQGQTSRVAGAMRDADVRRVLPFTPRARLFRLLLPSR
jgi:hypothetical protein